MAIQRHCLGLHDFVLHKIAKFNKQPPPTLTLEMFAAIDEASAQAGATEPTERGPQGVAATTKKVVSGFGKELARLKGIFTNKLSAFIFVLLAIAYMVSPAGHAECTNADRA
jgi:hypothetical protein